MGKRMISLLLSLVLLAGMTAVVPTVGAAETQSEQTGASGTTGSCTWSLSGTVLTISGNGRMKDYNVSYGTKPPWGTNITQVIVNYGVTYIGEDAFYGCENLTEVHLADGTLTEIGESAFAMCKNLEEIVIPDSVETIQSYVFGYCFALKEVTLSKNLSFLGFDAFLRCHALEHIELPDSITSLAGEVFYMCTALKSVRLPAHLDSICSGAFQSCAALESLVLPDTLTIIQSTAFRGCTKLAAINIPSGVTDFGASVFEGTAWLKNQPEGGLYINNCLLDYVGECPEVLTVRDGTVKIYGVMKQPTLQKVIIPHSVTGVLDSAFSGCTALTDFVIPDSVTKIGSRSLENTAWLKRQPDGIVTVDGILYQYKDCPRFVRVDARVVAAGAFGGSETLEEVEIHEGVAYINAGAFADCPALVAAGFFSDACAIGDGAFLNSPQLVFYCSHNSTAHLYAKANNIPFRKVSGQIGDLRWVMEGTKLTVYGSGNIPSGNGPWHDDVTEIVLGKGVGSVGNRCMDASGRAQGRRVLLQGIRSRQKAQAERCPSHHRYLSRRKGRREHRRRGEHRRRDLPANAPCGVRRPPADGGRPRCAGAGRYERRRTAHRQRRHGDPKVSRRSRDRGIISNHINSYQMLHTAERSGAAFFRGAL